jgi:hypothetical protein
LAAAHASFAKRFRNPPTFASLQQNPESTLSAGIRLKSRGNMEATKS